MLRSFIDNLLTKKFESNRIPVEDEITPISMTKENPPK